MRILKTGEILRATRSLERENEEHGYGDSGRYSDSGDYSTISHLLDKDFFDGEFGEFADGDLSLGGI